MWKTNPIWAEGQALSFSIVTLWTWKDFLSPEIYKGGSEDYAKKPVLPAGKPIDRWTLDNLIFGKKWGLINNHNWITLEWCQNKLNQFHQVTGPTPGWLTRKPYYSFFEIALEKGNVRLPAGDELEDGVFDVNLVVMSKNVLFVKLLELEAKKEELNRYVDSLLGLRREIPGSV